MAMTLKAQVKKEYDLYKGIENFMSAMEEKGIFFGDVEGLRFSTTFNKTMHPYEPFEAAKGYEGPVLLVRGTEDKLVDTTTCEKYVEAYGDNCTFIELEGGNHNFSSIPVREQLFRHISEFCT